MLITRHRHDTTRDDTLRCHTRRAEFSRSHTCSCICTHRILYLFLSLFLTLGSSTRVLPNTCVTLTIYNPDMYTIYKAPRLLI